MSVRVCGGCSIYSVMRMHFVQMHTYSLYISHLLHVNIQNTSVNLHCILTVFAVQKRDKRKLDEQEKNSSKRDLNACTRERKKCGICGVLYFPLLRIYISLAYMLSQSLAHVCVRMYACVKASCQCKDMQYFRWPDQM